MELGINEIFLLNDLALTFFLKYSLKELSIYESVLSCRLKTDSGYND